MFACNVCHRCCFGLCCLLELDTKGHTHFPLVMGCKRSDKEKQRNEFLFQHLKYSLPPNYSPSRKPPFIRPTPFLGPSSAKTASCKTHFKKTSI